MASPPSPARRAALSREVLDVVEPMLEEGDSYAELSVERMITAVGISRSTFYVYFKDKGDLLQAMTADVTVDLAGAGQTWFAFPTDGTRADLRAALAALFATYRRHRTILGAITETAAYDPRVRDGQRALLQAAVDGLRGQITAQQQAGRTAADLDPVRTAQWLTGMLENGLHRLVSPAPEPEAAALLDAATALVWRVLYAG